MSKATDAVLAKETLSPSVPCWRASSFAATAIGRFLASCCRKEMLIFNVTAFLLGRIIVMGELMPCGLAFFIAVAAKRRAAASTVALSTLAGSVSIGYWGEAACYLAAILAFLGLTVGKKRRQPPWIAQVCIAAGGLVAGIVLWLWQFISLYQFMLLGFSVAITLVLVRVFAVVLPLLSAAASRQTTDEQAVCLGVLLAAAIAGVGQAQLFGYSLRNIAGGFFIMMLTLRGGVGLGVSAGTAIGIVTGLSEGNAMLHVAYYALAALFGGVFTALGKFAIALGYLTGCLLAVSYFTANEQIQTVLGETAAAALLFLAIPGNWQGIWRQRVSQDVWSPDLAVSDTLMKLNRMADVFADLAGALEVRETAPAADGDIRQVVDRLEQQVCRICGQREACWESRFYNTYQAFLDLLSLPPVVKPDLTVLPPLLRKYCQRQQQLLTAAGEMLEDNRITLFWQKRLSEHRAMLAEQMRSAGGIIDTLTAEIRRAASADKQAELCLSAAALAAGCELESVEIIGQGCGLRISGRKQPCGGEQECLNKLLPVVAGELGRRLTVNGKCGSKTLHRKCRLLFSAASRYTVDIGAASVAKGQAVSGDTCSVTEAGQGRIAAIISDGMGSGSTAACESQMAVRFLEKLLAADFSVAAAVRSVNAMLLLRMPGECYATIDAAVFDLHNGEVEFLKTGSAASYIKRVREVTVMQSTSLPVGIIEQVEIEPQRRQLTAGDTVVMVSDGITEADKQKPRRDWVANFLRVTPDDDPQKLAGLIIEQAQKLAGPVIHDDMTVLVLKVREYPGGY